MKSYQRAVDSNFYKRILLVLISILYSAISYSKPSSQYNRILLKTSDKLNSFPSDRLGILPTLIHNLNIEPNPDIENYSDLKKLNQTTDYELNQSIIPRFKRKYYGYVSFGDLIVQPVSQIKDAKQRKDALSKPLKDHEILNHYSHLMMINGLKKNIFSILFAYEMYYPAFYEEFFYPETYGFKISKSKIKKFNDSKWQLKEKIELRLCALLSEVQKKHGNVILQSICDSGKILDREDKKYRVTHELNDFLKIEIESYLQHRAQFKKAGDEFRGSLSFLVKSLNEDISMLNGTCRGIRKGYLELVNMDMVIFAKSIREAGYEMPKESLGRNTGSNYSGGNAGSDEQQEEEALLTLRKDKIETYYSIRFEREVEPILKTIKNHGLINLSFSEKFSKAIGEFSNENCHRNGKGLKHIDREDVMDGAYEILYSTLYSHSVEYVRLYENLRKVRGAYTTDSPFINSESIEITNKAIKKLVRLSPLSVVTVMNNMGKTDATVYLKHLSQLVITMTRNQSNREWWMGVTKKIYTKTSLAGAALLFTGIPILREIGLGLEIVSIIPASANAVLNAVNYAYSTKAFRYSKMAGLVGDMDDQIAEDRMKFFQAQTQMSKKALKNLAWELPLMLVGANVVKLSKIKKAIRPFFYKADSPSLLETMRKLENLTLDHIDNANRINKLKGRLLRNIAIMMNPGAVKKIIEYNIQLWMTLDDATWKLLSKRLEKLSKKRARDLGFKRLDEMAEFADLFDLHYTFYLYYQYQKFGTPKSPGKFVSFFRGLSRYLGGKIDDVGRGISNGVGNAGRMVRDGATNLIIRQYGEDGVKQLKRGWDRFTDVVENFYSFAYFKHGFFKYLHSLTIRYNINGHLSGYIALKYKHYLNEAVRRGYLTLEDVATIVNEKQIHIELQQLYMRHYIDDTGKLISIVDVAPVKPRQKYILIENFVTRFNQTSNSSGRLPQAVQDYLRPRLHRANLGTDELNVLIQKLYDHKIQLNNVHDARLLMDYIRDISRYPPWKKMSALNYLDQLFTPRIREAADRGEDVGKLFTFNYWRVSPVQNFYHRRAEFFEHRDWLYKRMKTNYRFRLERSRARKPPLSDSELRKISTERARATQEMRLGCASRTGSIFRNYAKGAYKSFNMNSGILLAAVGYTVQNFAKDKNFEYYWRFIYDITMTAFGKFLKNKIMMNTANTAHGKMRSTTMIMAYKDIPDAWLNIKSIEWVRKYLDGTVPSSIPEDILKDENFKHGIYAIHNSIRHNLLEVEDKAAKIVDKLNRAENVNEVMYAFHPDAKEEIELSERDQEIYDQISIYMDGKENLQKDIFMMLEDLDYQAQTEMKEYGLKLGSAAKDRYWAHRTHGLPMAYFSYGLSQSIYYNLCYGIRNPKASYVTSFLAYYTVGSIRSSFYYWWMNQTGVTQPEKFEEEDEE